MDNCLGSLVDYGGSDDEGSRGEETAKTIVSAEEVYAEDGGEEEEETSEPAVKRSRVEEDSCSSPTGGVDSAVDSFLAEIGDDLQKIPEEQIEQSQKEEGVVEKKEKGSEEEGAVPVTAAAEGEGEGEGEDDIDGEEIPIDALPALPTAFESAIVEKSAEEKEREEREEEERKRAEEEAAAAAEKAAATARLRAEAEAAAVAATEEKKRQDEQKRREEEQRKREEEEKKLPYFKLANRCANAMKSTLNVRSVQMEEYGGFRVYLRYDDVPICLLSSMGQHESEITARRSAVRELVGQMLDLGLFPPGAKKILAEKITTVDKMIEVTKPVLSYLKFQLSDQRYQKMLRDDSKMSIKADCTQIQLQLITGLIDQLKFFTYRFYAEPTNNPWLHLAPANSVAPSAYTGQNGVAAAAAVAAAPGSYYGGIERDTAVAVYPDFEMKIEPVYGAGEYGMEYAAPPMAACSSSSSSFPAPSSIPSGSTAVPPPLATGMKLRIIEDAQPAAAVPTSSFFALPPPPVMAPMTGGFQSQFVRTVSVMTHTPVKEEPMSAALSIKVPKHDVISEIVERTIVALGWTERNDTIMVGMTRKRAYLWVDEVPIAILGAMGESEKLSEAVSWCTHELMEQLCAWSLFPLDMVSQICRNKDHLNPLLYSMGSALNFISTTLREPQYMSLHRTQGMARVPLEAPASHLAVAIGFRCRVKAHMDKFWESHKIKLGPMIPLPKLEQWERTYFYKTEADMPMPEIKSEMDDSSTIVGSGKSGIDLPWAGSGDAPAETEEYL